MCNCENVFTGPCFCRKHTAHTRIASNPHNKTETAFCFIPKFNLTSSKITFPKHLLFTNPGQTGHAAALSTHPLPHWEAQVNIQCKLLSLVGSFHFHLAMWLTGVCAVQSLLKILSYPHSYLQWAAAGPLCQVNTGDTGSPWENLQRFTNKT